MLKPDFSVVNLLKNNPQYREEMSMTVTKPSEESEYNRGLMDAIRICEDIMNNRLDYIEFYGAELCINSIKKLLKDS